MSDKSAETGKEGRGGKRRGFPPLSVVAIVTFCVLVIVAARFYEPVVGYVPDGAAGDVVLQLMDRANVNIVTYVFSFIAIVTPLIWFACKSQYPLPIRVMPLVLLNTVLIATPVLCEIRASGELWPTFRPRWWPRIESVSATAARDVDLVTTTPNDYPQFLGPRRNATISGVSLVKDWNTASPKQLWKQPIGTGWSAFAVVNGFAVTMEQRGDDELVTCYEVETGKLRWSHATTARHDSAMGGLGPRSTPTIHEGKVYTLGATGRLHCLNGRDGAVIWSKDLLAEFGIASPSDDQNEIPWGRASSPLIVDDLVVVPAGGPAPDRSVSLVAYNKDSGEKVWEGGSTQISYSSPIETTIAGVRQVVSVNEKNVTGHDPKTGEILWEFEWPGSSSAGANVSQPAPIATNRLLLSKGYAQGAALIEFDAEGNPSQVWHKKTVLKTKFTNVVVRDGYIYGLSDGVLECVEAESGRKQWKNGRYGQGQIMLLGDTILIQAESGEVALVAASPQGHNEYCRFQAISGTTWNNPTLSGRHLLVRNGQEAACFEVNVDAAGTP